MASGFSPWLRRKASASIRPAKCRPFRREDAFRLVLESLEDRTLLTTWTDIAGAFNSGMLNVSAKTTTLANSAFDLSIPLVRSSFSQALDVPGKLQSPFGLKLDPNQTNLDQLKMDLQGLGFTVERLDINPDPTTHDLVRLSKDFSFGVGSAFFSVDGIGGDLGFSYFDDHVAGGLNISTLTASVQPIKFHVTFGVDLVGSTPQLFLQDSTPDTQGKSTGLDPFTITGQTHLTGMMNIKNLLNVNVGGDVILSLSAGLSFKSPDSSHKLRVADLTSTNIIGTLSGPRGGQDPAISFANVTLSTQLPILRNALTWTGNFFANIITDSAGNKTINKTGGPSTPGPDPLAWAWGTLQNLVGGLFNITPSLDFLKPISSALNFKIPLFNFTLGDKLGVGDLSKITGLAANIGSEFQSAEAALNSVGIYVGIPPAATPPNNPKTWATSPPCSPTSLRATGWTCSPSTGRAAASGVSNSASPSYRWAFPGWPTSTSTPASAATSAGTIQSASALIPPASTSTRARTLVSTAASTPVCTAACASSASTSPAPTAVSASTPAPTSVSATPIPARATAFILMRFSTAATCSRASSTPSRSISPST